ncbi:glycogen/starch/alpha-glucan phosphorylase [Desulfocurvibacter africanus PCS]|uniref:Alpha-1,4 glucan phosphorylase n=1 Tax=Desulfocurvibacter africanus PCS TaxID=1262666 RepID=M5Q1T8_DESAF|nr:glycogen/starch/alpha-glucan phosphorylase [Desulfocurvibacter africanus PCS]
MAITIPRNMAEEKTSAEVLGHDFCHHLYYSQGKIGRTASLYDIHMAASRTVRDRILHRWMNTVHHLVSDDFRVVAYLSAEFLIGPQMSNNLLCLGLTEAARQGLSNNGFDLDAVISQEIEPGLGNGGLGRLAACYLDSLASLDIPAIGYGIHYEFGLFSQAIADGWQVEQADRWLRMGSPWELLRPDMAYEVGFGGHTTAYTDGQGRYSVRWEPAQVIRGMACDLPIPGYQSQLTIPLRLWRAEAVEAFDLATYNTGDYMGAVLGKIKSENVTKVLYPVDEMEAGKRLRLMQQFFFVSCSLQDMLRIHLLKGKTPEAFNETYAVQLNDTHPAVAVAELMRLLVDTHGLAWEQAWETTRKAFAFTNHTLLPEAMERWPVGMFGKLLPRHLEIIYEINRRFLDEVRAMRTGDEDLVSRLSLIDESGERYVRMAHLACVGSHAINGVASLHTELLKSTVLKDFHALWPDKILNVTNGVTPRRWVALSNPRLAALLDESLGTEWIREWEATSSRLAAYAGDAGFRARWREIKQANKFSLAKVAKERTGMDIDPASLFDIQVKRIHEYKRQHLNVLHIVSRYLKLKNEPHADVPPRTFIFAGKAAPSYFMAKLIIRLITGVSVALEKDKATRDRLKVAFLPNFNVGLGQIIYPAANLSEQISLAGKEASGTGNMKFMMNGALTIGTLDGANVEILDAVGEQDFFLFGLDAHEVAKAKAAGYSPRGCFDNDPILREALGLISSGFFSDGDGSLFQPLVDSLLHRDEYMLLADFGSYCACQERVDAAWRDQDAWSASSIRNVAGSGRFSSDRAIREYCRNIWDVEPMASLGDEVSFRDCAA